MATKKEAGAAPAAGTGQVAAMPPPPAAQGEPTARVAGTEQGAAETGRGAVGTGQGAGTVTTPTGRKFRLAFRKPDLAVGHRVLIYGAPGKGKTTLMLKGLPRPLVAFDFDQSIERLLAKPAAESGIDPEDVYLADVPRDAEGRLDYGAFLSILRDRSNFEGVRSVLVDTGTFAEKAIEPYMFEHPDKYPTGNSKKPKATSLADYAFRGGNIYKQDLYQLMLGYLDNLATAHVHVGLVYHTAVGKVPNLGNADGYSLQYQPDSWQAGKTSLADTAMGWADHVGAIKDETVSDGAGGKVERVVGGPVISFEGDGVWIGKSRTLVGEAATVPLAEFALGMLGIR